MPSLLDVRKLTVEFPSSKHAVTGARNSPEHYTAVRDLSFQIAPGEVLGLVGESGSGKSVTSLAVMRLLPRQARISGEIHFANNGSHQNLLQFSEDQIRKIRGSGIGMIFQEPMTALNPTMRVGDQIAEAILAHGGWEAKITKQEAWSRSVEAMKDVANAEADRRSRDYPHQLSGGMRQRVMIAMAIANRPQLLIADEPTTALDVTIQAQILDLLEALRRRFGLAMLFISHDLAVVSRVADRVAVMYAGSLVEIASRQDLFHAPAHPYTRGLLHAVPTLKTERTHPLETIEGVVPSPQTTPVGCPFEPRCGFRIASCRDALPPIVEVSPQHWARCPVINP